MKKSTWTLLLVLVGVVLLYTFATREGVDDTLTKEPECPPGFSLDGEKCRREYGPPSLCRSGTLENGFCMNPDGSGGTSGTGALCVEGTRVGGKCVGVRDPRCPDNYVFQTEGPYTYKCATRDAVTRWYEAQSAGTASDPTAPRNAPPETGPTPHQRNASSNAPPETGPTPPPRNAPSNAPPETGPTPPPRNASSGGTPGVSDTCRTEIETKQWSDVSADCKSSATGSSPPAPAAPATPAAPTGNSTGGSSTIPKPNSGGSAYSGAKKGNIWGPAYTGMGDNAGDGSGNGLRDYPTLLGPQPKTSTMVEGAGIAGVSQHRSLVTSGTLPGAKNTGSDPSSQFFGMSRTSAVPGDQDLFPNPYQEFTASIGSAKTEPVPFLSDFSAFLR